jgi:hypothetical protein
MLDKILFHDHLSCSLPRNSQMLSEQSNNFPCSFAGMWNFVSHISQRSSSLWKTFENSETYYITYVHIYMHAHTDGSEGGGIKEAEMNGACRKNGEVR